MNAEGTATHENEIYLQSLQGRIDMFKASWQALANTVISSDFLKELVDSGTAFLDVLDGIVSFLGPIPTMIGAIAAAVSALKGKGFFEKGDSGNTFLGKSIKNIVADYKNGYGVIGSVFQNNTFDIPQTEFNLLADALDLVKENTISADQAMSQMLAKCTPATKELFNSMVAAGKGSEALTSGLKSAGLASVAASVGMAALNAAISMGLSLIVQGAIQWISHLIHAQEELHESVQEAIQDYTTQHSKLAEGQNEFSRLVDRYGELSKGVNEFGERVSLTTEEYEEYKSVTNSIADQVPSLVQGWNDQGVAILKCKDDVSQLVTAYEDMIRASNNAILMNGRDIFKDFRNSSNSLVGNGEHSDAPQKRMVLAEMRALEDIYHNGEQAIISYDEATLESISYALQRAGMKFAQEDSNLVDFILRTVRENGTIIKTILGEFNQDMDSAIEGMIQTGYAYAENAMLDQYPSLSPTMQSIVKRIIGDLDFDALQQFESLPDFYAWINGLLDDLSSLDQEGQEAFSLAFDMKTKLNNGECTVGEYMAAIAQLRTFLSGLDEETQKAFSLAFDFDDKEIEDGYNKILNAFRERNNSLPMREDLRELYDRSFVSWLNGLSKEEMDVAIELSFNPDSVNWNEEQWRANVEDHIGKIVEETSITFSDFLADGTFKSEADAYISEIQKIAEALDKLHNGKITEDELRVEFPQLSGYDDVEAGLVDMANKATKVMQDRINEQAQNLVASDIPVFQKWGEAIINVGQAALKTASNYDKLSAAIANIEKGSKLLTSISEYEATGKGDLLGMLSSVIELADASGQSISDFVTLTDGKLEFQKQTITDWATAWINALDIDGELKDFLKEQVASTYEAEEAYKGLSNSIDQVTKTITLMKNAQKELDESGKNSIETLSSLIGQYGDRWTEFANISTDGTIIIDVDAIREDMLSVVDAAEGISDEAKEALKSALSIELEEEDFKGQIDSYVNDLKELQSALDSIRSGTFSDEDLYSLITMFPALAGHTKDLDTAIVALLDDMDADVLAAFDEQLAKADTTEKRAEILGLRDAVIALRKEAEEGSFSLSFETISGDMANMYSAIKESVSATGMSAESVKALQTRYESLGYSAADLTNLFVQTSAGIELNTDAMRRLESEYEQAQQTQINEYLDGLVEQYNDLTQQIIDAGDAASTTELYAQRAELLKQIEDVSLLSAEYAGLTSTFNKWKEAQSMGEKGDMYDDLAGDLKNIKELYDDGLVGTNKFRAAVQLMTDVDVSDMGADELVEIFDKGYPKLERYFTEGRKGIDNLLTDISSLNSEWAHLTENGDWEINIPEDKVADIAKQLGISSDALYQVFNKMSDFGADINFDSVFADLELIQTKAEGAAQKLQEIGATDYEFNFSATSIERLDEQIEQAKQILDSFKNEDGTLNINAEGAKEAQYVLATLLLQKQELSKPFVMNIDANNVSGELGNALRLIQEFKSAYDDLEVQKSIGADTSDAEKKVEDIQKKIKALGDESPEIMAKLGFDGDYTPENIESTISEISPEILVGIDSTLVDQFESAEHKSDGQVIWKNITTAVDNYKRIVHKAVGEIKWKNNTSAVKTTFTAKGTVYSAKARGTAYARGNWGTTDSGVALGGELGQEIVVRDGKYFTIGDSGAEFFRYKRGDIIFNADQTREIFEKGKLTSANSRGRSFAGSSIKTNLFNNSSNKSTTKAKSGVTGSLSSSKKTTSSKKTSSSSKTKSSSSKKTTSTPKVPSQADIQAKLKEALEYVNEASNYLSVISDESASFVDKLTSALSIYEKLPGGGSLDDLFKVGENGQIDFFGNSVENQINSYIDGIVKAGYCTKEFGEQLKDAAKAEIEQENALGKLNDAISRVNNVSAYLTKINDNDVSFIDKLANAASLLEDMPSSSKLEDLFTIDTDGTVTFFTESVETYINSYIDSMVEAGQVTQELAEKLKDAAKAEVEQENVLDNVANAISRVSEVSTYLTKINNNDVSFVDKLSSAVSLLGKMPSGSKIEDLLTIDTDGTVTFLSDAVEKYINEYIDAMVEAGQVTQELAAKLKDAAKAEVQQENALGKMADTISRVNEASNYLTKINDSEIDFIDKLSSAVELLKNMPDGTSLDDLLSINSEGDVEFFTDIVEKYINEYIDALVTAGSVSEELAAKLRDAAKAETIEERTLTKLTRAYDKVNKAASLVNAANKELATSGKNSMETLSSVMDLFEDRWEEFVEYFSDGSFTINTSKVKAEIGDLVNGLEDVSENVKLAMLDAFDENYLGKIDDYVESVKTLQTALENLRSGDFSSSDLYSLLNEFPELAQGTDDLEASIKKLMDSMETNVLKVFADQLKSVDTKEARTQLISMMKAVRGLREEFENFDFEIDFEIEFEEFENVLDAIKESVSATGLSADSVKNLKKRYENLAIFDPVKLFENTANGIHLNTHELRELEHEYEQMQKKKIDDQLNSLIDEYNRLTEEINHASTAAELANLYAQRSEIMDQIEDVRVLADQYVGLTSAFNKWQLAQSLGEEGDLYDSLANGLEDIIGLWEEGLIGTNKFRTAVQLMSNEDLHNASIDELIATYESSFPLIERYFQETSDGVLNFLNDIHELNSEWVRLNEDGSWDINFGIANDQEIADALGLNVETIQSILRKLSDYGFDINLDSAYSKLDLVQSKAEIAAQTLKDIGATDYTFNFNSTNIDRIAEQITIAEATLNKFKDADGTINIEMPGAQEAQYVLGTLIVQKQQLEAPIIMAINADDVSGEIGELLRTLQEFQIESNNLIMQATVGADTANAQAKVDSLVATIANANPELLAKLGFADEITPESIKETINSLTPEVLVGLDPSLVDAYMKADHTSSGEVVWDNNTAAVDNYANTRKMSEGIVTWTNDISRVIEEFKAKGIVEWSDSTYYASGTAHIRGSAFAKGDWGTKNSGTALGGELGQELVVRDGRFFTIGDRGAEFFKYKRGDIIFNAAQTKEIFENGRITSGNGRGSVYAEGTAFSSGSGRITASGKTITKARGSSSDDDGGGGDSDEPSKMDWIEVALERIQAYITKLGRTAGSVYKTIVDRLKATDEEISAVEKEIDTQRRGYDRYLQEANSVRLSEDLKKKVREGTIDINEYSGSTKELIDEYKEWYDKALACADAVEELNETLGDLYKSRFDKIQTEFDNQLSMLQHMTNTYDNGLDMIEERGYLGGKAFYESLRNIERDNISIMKKELDGLNQTLSEALNSGTIDIYSESWYDMRKEINSVEEAIQEAEIATVKYANAIREIEWDAFDYLQERISDVSDEAEFFIDLMESSSLFTDAGKLSDTGMSQLGMHTQIYDTLMLQADKYAEQIGKINADLARDPNSKTLISKREELLGLQRKSIKAAEDEKRAVASLVEEGIKRELDSLKSLIDTYEDSLSSAKDLYDYQKKVNKQSAGIVSMQKQLSAYQGDTSEENRARIQKLQVNLDDAVEELQETQYDQYIKDQKQILDDLYDDYEEILNARLDDIDALMNEMIDVVNANSEIIANTIREEGDAVGYIITDGMASIWNNSFGNPLAQYSSNFGEQATGVNGAVGAIASSVASMISSGDRIAGDYTGIDYSGSSVTGKLNEAFAKITEPYVSDFGKLVNTAPQLQGLVDLSDYLASVRNNYGAANTSIGEIKYETNIEIDHVDNYNDLVEKMKNDSAFEKMIQTITIGRINNQASLAKRKYVW